MELRGSLSHLIGSAYAAALDPSCWTDWTEDATRLLGGTCGGLHVVEPPGHFRHQTIFHKNMAVVERYHAEQVGRLDPQLPYVAKLRHCCVYADTDHLDPEEPGTAEYLAWQSSNGGLRHYVTAIVPLPGDRVAGLSVHFGSAEGPVSSGHRSIMAVLLPHLARAAMLGFVHAEKLNEAYWDGLLGVRNEPCALLADDGRILRATSEMEAVLAMRDGVGCRDGRLVQTHDAGDLLHLVRGQHNAPHPRSCRVHRPSGRRAYIVTGYPLQGERAFLVSAQAAALVTIVDPHKQPCPPAEVWREIFGLSAREAEIATLLLSGHSVESAAEHLRIGTATARVHLRNLFTKTEVNRQSELLRLLSRRT